MGGGTSKAKPQPPAPTPEVKKAEHPPKNALQKEKELQARLDQLSSEKAALLENLQSSKKLCDYRGEQLETMSAEMFTMSRRTGESKLTLEKDLAAAVQQNSFQKQQIDGLNEKINMIQDVLEKTTKELAGLKPQLDVEKAARTAAEAALASMKTQLELKSADYEALSKELAVAKDAEKQLAVEKEARATAEEALIGARANLDKKTAECAANVARTESLLTELASLNVSPTKATLPVPDQDEVVEENVPKEDESMAPAPEFPKNRQSVWCPKESDNSKVIGVLRIDYNYPPAVGDIAHPDSFGYTVHYETVHGLTFERCQAGALDDEIMTNLQNSILKLQEHPGLVGITGDCGFMMHYQCPVRFMAQVPAFMSSLIQCPAIGAIFKLFEKVLVLSANSNSLEPMKETLLTQAGFDVDDPSRYEVYGLQDLDGFDAVAKGEAVDLPRVEVAITEAVMKKLADDASIKAILLECTELPAYADALRRATGLPVFDAITTVNFFRNATVSSHWNKKAFIPHNPAYWTTKYSKFGSEIVNEVEEVEGVEDETLCAPPFPCEDCDAIKIIGVLRIDYNYPPAPGDIDHPDSYGYKVVFRVVHGLTFAKCQDGVMDDQIVESFRRAVDELEAVEGLAGITGDCGFMMHYQCLVRHMAEKPVFMSALLQAPLISAAFKNFEKILVVTANSNTLLAARDTLLTTCGFKVDDPNQFVIHGLQDLEGFDAVEKGEAADTCLVQHHITERLKQVVKDEQTIRAILLECTELPHYADHLRRKIGLPVFDAITCVNYFRSSAITSHWNKAFPPHNPEFWKEKFTKFGLKEKNMGEAVK